MSGLSELFNTFSAVKTKFFDAPVNDAQPQGYTGFAIKLDRAFDKQTAAEVFSSFKKMQLPPPEEDGTFLEGTEGLLVLLNKYGLVVRIENKQPSMSDRVYDSSLIIQPIAAIDCGEAVIEICPGTKVAEDIKDSKLLSSVLKNQNIDFWDDQLANTGLLPIKMPSFPEGIPVVIDRGAVSKLSGSINGIRNALISSAENAQEELYGPLREAFAEGWSNLEKMKDFWKLCEKHVAEGKLITGWNNDDNDRYSKTPYARASAKKYEQKFYGLLP